MCPDIVPDKLENKINYKVVFIIIGIIISFQVSLFFLPNRENAEDAIFAAFFIEPLIAGITSFIVAKRYRKSETFGRSYFALGCGFLSAAIAEIMYDVYDLVLHIDPYPSIADVFFFALYPFVLTHLILNIRFFKPKITPKEITWMTAIPVVIVSSYIITSLSQIEEINFDFYYGIIFVVMPAIALPFAILGAKVFKGGVLSSAWLTLVFSIVALTIGDVWYYHLEIFDEYNLLHPVHIFWHVGYWITVYSLYKHKQSI